MGLSSSKSTSKVNETNQQTGTTTPFMTIPGVAEGLEDITNRIGAFGNMDPNSFVAGSSPLQRMAWENVGSLGDWQGQARGASEMAQGAGQAGATLAGNPNNAGGPAYGWNAATGQASTYGAPQLGPANLVSARGYQAPSAQATGYAAPRVGQPIGAQAYNYTAQPTGKETIAPNTGANGYNYTAQQAGGTQIGPLANAQAGSLLDNLKGYYDPFAESVIKSTMADNDRYSDQQRAALAAQGARNGAFGGSRFGVAQAELEGNIGRNRDSLLSGMRSQAFGTAAGLSQSDAANRQQTNLANAQAANNRALAQAGMDQERNFFNTSNVNAQRQFGADTGTRVSMFNSGNDLTRNLTQAGMNQDVNMANSAAVNAQRQFGAAAGNTTSMFNSGQGLQAALAQAGLDENAARFGAETNRDVGLWNAGAQERAGQFNANLGAQSDAANQQALNQYGLAQAGFDQSAGQFNADAGTRMTLANLGFQNDAAAQGAAANNQMSQFNASQQEAAHQRALQAAGLMGNISGQYGAGVRDDLQLMAGLGDQQRAIEQQFALSPLAQLQELSNLYGTTPYNLFAGQNVQTNGTMSGTNVTKQSPSLFNQLLAAGQVASSFI